MNCKQCGKPLYLTLAGLRGFCSHECKKAHRMAYKANWIKRKRDVDIKGGYVSINPSNVDTANPHEKPIYKGENQGHGLFEGNFPVMTVKEGENIAKKHCPEYKRKVREGYCLQGGISHEIECMHCINAKRGNT